MSLFFGDQKEKINKRGDAKKEMEGVLEMGNGVDGQEETKLNIESWC